MGGLEPRDPGAFGLWTGYRVPADRSDWHPLVRQFYSYWLAIAPSGKLPGRQHVVPENIAALWTRLFLLDVYRQPLRFRYRLCGTELVRSLGREMTGAWLDEAHPQLLDNPESRDRYSFMVETGCPTWRRGRPLWSRHPDDHTIESCIAPLAADGRTVDKLLGVTVLFDGNGRPL